jgi:glycosyltransferase involved in cell wall biosynthesis
MFKHKSGTEAFAQFRAFLSFALYKTSLISEKHYLSALESCAKSILSTGARYVYVHYQDYVPMPTPCSPKDVADICEMIISTDSNTLNHSTSLRAASLADVVVCPSSAIASNLQMAGIQPCTAPYGGDKSSYMTTSRKLILSSNRNQSLSEYSLLITARANSYRKGLDVLLDSLEMLDDQLGSRASRWMDVRICGAIAPGKDAERLQAVIDRLDVNACISVTAQQYSQHDYLRLVESSDLFVMPSRLEGTSPAALEALWHGVPCILSQECGVDAFLDGRHGIQLAALTSIDLTKAIMQMILNPERLAGIKHNLIADKRLFAWDRYLDAYKTMLLSHAVAH